MKLHDTAVAIFVVMVWAFNVVAAKAGVEQIPAMLLLACRMALIAVLAVWFVPMPRRREIPGLFLLALVIGPLHFGLTTMAVLYIDAGTATIGLQTMAPFAVLLAWMVFGDPIGWRRIAGMVIAFAGILLVTGQPHVADNVLGIVLIVVSGFFFAVANVLMRWLRPTDATAMNVWIAVFAAPQALLVSFAIEDRQWAVLVDADWRGYGAIAYQAIIASLIGHTLWIRLIARYRTNQTMPFTLLMPAFGVLFGALVFGERVTWETLAGGAVTAFGVWLVVMGRLAASEPVRAVR
ncbi:MAG: EamA family transporter [Alphaproteobacteria bacterium]|nr:EamA family transporter [Alphaproteobacteria bacterium]